jgi:uncharacterized RmlC-like cupin family protein
MEARSIRRVRPGDRTIPDGPATPGVHREIAFEGSDHWVGHATTVPGVMSGWHHHGDHDTFLYVVHGAIALEHGPDGSAQTLVSAGDFALVPRGVVHREGTPPGEPAEIVVVRIGSGPPVVAMEGPEPAR